MTRLLSSCDGPEDGHGYRGVKPHLVLVMDGLCLHFSLLQVGFDFQRATKIIADLIDIGEIQGWILLSDIFGSGSITEGGYQGVKGNACLAHSHHTIRVSRKGDDFCSK
jgi:hypothetical protein